MADRGDRFAGVHHVSREIDHGVAHPHPVRRIAARDDERVEITGLDSSSPCVRRDDGLPALTTVLEAGRRAYDCDRDAGSAQGFEGTGQLAVVEAFLDEHGDTLSRHESRFVHRRAFYLSPNIARSPGCDRVRTMIAVII